MRFAFALLFAPLLAWTGCVAQKEASNSDPRMRPVETDSPIHGEVGATYAQGAGHR